jgi:hypothetical protein
VERLAALVMSALVTLSTPVADVAPDRPGPWQARGFVAHALGVPPNGPVYTNSVEAFRLSYAKGFRTFEVDLVRLRDGKILAAHDRAEAHYGLPKGTTFGDVTAQQMRGRRFDGLWTTLIDTDLVALLEHYRDANLILDTKGAMRQQIAMARRLARIAPPSVRQRLVPHVHNQLHLDALRKMKAFDDFVFATYLWPDKTFADAPAFMKRNRLRTFMIGYGYYTEELRMKFIRAGAEWIFVHSIRVPEDVVRWRLRGVGVYSDDWIMAV